MRSRFLGVVIALPLLLGGCAGTVSNPHVQKITSKAEAYLEKGKEWIGWQADPESAEGDARSADGAEAPPTPTTTTALAAEPAAAPTPAAAPSPPRTTIIRPAEPLATADTPALMPAPVEEVNLQEVAAAGIDFGTYHALIIGNNRYRHIEGLQSAVSDATRLDEILRTEYGFQTRLLIDADRDQILSALTDYRRSLGPQDNLLIYYAGHGWVDPEADEGYWLPVDAQADDPVRWLSNATLTTSVRAMRAKHILVIADSCFSGKLTRGAKIGIRGADYLQRMATRRARTVLTSGGLEPVLDEGGKGGHSVFASSLFEVLDDNAGVIDTAQLFNVVRRRVALAAPQVPEYGDIRQAGHDGGDFLFVRQR
ncbi:MAG: caspase family protein [Rhodocyclaceae bacterium]|nr:caspase family protein [Rhodocyclaceae bacterium]